MTAVYPDSERLERSHYALQRSLYFSDEEDLNGATAFFAHDIHEPEWNHAALIDGPDKGQALEGLLRRIETLYESRGLAPAVEVGPSCRPSNLADRLADRGYERCYRYAWLARTEAAWGEAESAVEIRAEIRAEVRTVHTQADADAFFGVFQAVYSQGLDPGYERLLRTPATMHRCDVLHYLALRKGIPAAVASSLQGRSGEATGTTGFCNLAVHPDHRQHGLGGLLIRHRIAEARKRGKQAIFLQTEQQSVEDWLCRRGFQLAFFTEGWARPVAGS